MPCDTVTTIGVKVAAWNAARATAAIREAGINARYENGRLDVRAVDQAQAEKLTARVAQVYARLTLTESAKRFGWTPTAAARTDTGLTTFNLVRR